MPALGGMVGPVAAGSATTSVSVLVALAAGLLVPAGVAKLRDPAVARQALGLSPHLGDGTFRAVGAGELVLAVAVLAVGGRVTTALLAAAYATFAGVAVRQRARGAGCGCFGTASTAPTHLAHVVVNVVAAVAAVAATVIAAPALLTLVVVDPVFAVPTLVAALVGVASARTLLTAFPDLAAAAAEADGGAA